MASILNVPTACGSGPGPGPGIVRGVNLVNTPHRTHTPHTYTSKDRNRVPSPHPRSPKAVPPKPRGDFVLFDSPLSPLLGHPNPLGRHSGDTPGSTPTHMRAQSNCAQHECRLRCQSTLLCLEGHGS
mmetsp:Transcript_68186/g.120614  ORF Transcript_68186/g.120614 Transcript_68186/m.120614 type:complete len:127 (-) Transcript_68186:409-789(-)